MIVSAVLLRKGMTKEYKHKDKHVRKITRQGSGSGTKTGQTKGTLKKYIGQGGKRKSVTR